MGTRTARVSNTRPTPSSARLTTPSPIVQAVEIAIPLLTVSRFPSPKMMLVSLREITALSPPMARHCVTTKSYQWMLLPHFDIQSAEARCPLVFSRNVYSAAFSSIDQSQVTGFQYNQPSDFLKENQNFYFESEFLTANSEIPFRCQNFRNVIQNF